MPTWLNLIYQPYHVSVWRKGGREGYYPWFPPGHFPVEDGGGPVKWIQTLFIFQNYVSPLWHCTKSKWKTLICCIDSHCLVPPFHTYGARPPVADTEICHSRHMPHGALCCILKISVEYESWLWQMSRHEERCVTFVTMESKEYIPFWKCDVWCAA